MGQDTEQLSREISGTRRELSNDLDELQSRISPSAIVERRKAAARSRIHNMRDRVMGSVQGAQEGTSQMAGSVAGAAGTVADSARGTVEAAEQRIEGSPLAAGLVAFGAGMVVSALFPPSQMETERARQLGKVAREQGQPILEEAKAVGQDVGQKVLEDASEAAQQVKSTAAEAVENVKAEGVSSAQTVKDEVADQADGAGSGDGPSPLDQSGAGPA